MCLAALAAWRSGPWSSMSASAFARLYLAEQRSQQGLMQESQLAALQRSPRPSTFAAVLARCWAAKPS